MPYIKPFYFTVTVFLFLFLAPFATFAQDNVITGKVTDAIGNPLENVSVVVKGSTTGTATSNTGNFRITVTRSSGNTLVFSSVGFINKEVDQSSGNVMNVQLEKIDQSLDAVVVVGYGTQRKSDLTGSVGRVGMEEKSTLPNVNLLQALSGAAAGVNVQGAGLAGSEPNLSIRGQTSLSASDKPLIVLDDIIYNGSISDINVGDVETIDILKDASAAAVYGSRSANGVILITTKKGKTDKPVVSFNMYYGYQDMTNNPVKIMDGYQYALKLTDYYYQQKLYGWYATKPTSDAGKPVRPNVTDRNVLAANLRTVEERENFLAGKEINWMDEITRVAPIQNYNINFSGKSGKTNYFVSGSYTNEKGILLNDNFDRITVHSNLESKLTDWFTLGMISSYSRRDYSGLEADNGWDQTGARTASPLANNKIGSPNYDMFLTGEQYMPYPLNNLYVTNKDIRNSLFMVGKAKITVPWIKGLSYELNYSNTYSTRNNNTFYPVSTPNGRNNKGMALKTPTQQTDWIVNNIVSYLGTFGDHRVNATLLFSREHSNFDSSAMIAEGFDNAVLGYNSMALGTSFNIASKAWEENSLSYMARANYSFKNRYLLTATFRRDGFSGFSENKKFASFPSLSLGWVLSEESFFQNVKDVDLKIRLSYGKNGNQGIGRYSSFTRMGSSPYVFGPNTAIGVYANLLGNALLSWETTSSYNLGVDFGFLNRRITGSIDVYQATTSDVLVNRALPQASGYSSIWTNIGAINNKGIEIQLTTINLEGRLSWKTDFVFSLNRDKITKLYGDEKDKDIGNSWFVGSSISSIYDYEVDGGLWTEGELYKGTILKNWYPGQFKYVDLNDDGIIDANNDRKIIGYKTPNYRFSIGNTLNYQNFSLSFFLNSIQGGKGYYLADNSSVVNVDWNANTVTRVNASAVRPYWTPDNGVNNSTGVYNAPVVHGGIYEDRSFVRLQDVSLAYKVGDKMLKSLKVNAGQIYIASKNPYTWTKWSGWDPEIGNSNSPLMRNIIIGFKLTF
jgi:TonB-dependent starch-binding outer membrane protein SusC